jgi:hypothetical protein
MPTEFLNRGFRFGHVITPEDVNVLARRMDERADLLRWRARRSERAKEGGAFRRAVLIAVEGRRYSPRLRMSTERVAQPRGD